MRNLSILCLLAALVCCACESSDAPTAQSPSPRAVTFSPALTKMVYDLGLGAHLVGIDTFSKDYLPEGVDLPVIGDAFTVRTEPLLAVRPEVVLAQIAGEKFQTVRQVKPELRIESFTIETLDDIPAAARRLGNVLGNPAAGESAAAEFEATFKEVRADAADRQPVRCAFVTGYRNFLSAGRGTFLGDTLEAAGGTNVFADLDNWKHGSLETLMVRRPAVIICLVEDDAEGADARRYWQELGAGGDDPYRKRVVILTDATWTVPGLHMAERARQVYEFLHGEDGQ